MPVAEMPPPPPSVRTPFLHVLDLDGRFGSLVAIESPQTLRKELFRAYQRGAFVRLVGCHLGFRTRLDNRMP